MGTMINRQLQALSDLQRLLTRRRQPDSSSQVEESLTEEDFIRFFGTKVKKVRKSGRADLVGLVIVGQHNGIWITRGSDGKRRVRAVDVDGNGIHPLNRFVVLRDQFSLRNLRAGLLNWVN